VDRSRAVVCQRFNEYRQTILVALQEVEDALALERRQLERIEKLEIQVRMAGQAADQLLQFFVVGEASFLDTLSATQSVQRLQRSLLSARLDLILIRIGLYLAIGGDFDTRPVPFAMPADVPQLPPAQRPSANGRNTADDAALQLAASTRQSFAAQRQSVPEPNETPFEDLELPSHSTSRRPITLESLRESVW
jgi:hypothetical protein